mgnify:CR=1 FL=1
MLPGDNAVDGAAGGDEGVGGEVAAKGAGTSIALEPAMREKSVRPKPK